MGGIFSKKKKHNAYAVPSPPHYDAKKLTRTEIEAHVRNACGTSGDILINDRDYCVYTKADLVRFLNETYVNNYTYVKEGNDCDNFAKMLLGLHMMWTATTAPAEPAFGLVTGDLRPSITHSEPYYHAMNFAIVKNEANGYELLFIEPQSDKLRYHTENSIYWIFLL